MNSTRKTIGVFAYTNDCPSLETGVTQYNFDLIKSLCKRYPNVVFYLYLSSDNSKRFDSVNFENLNKVVIPTQLLESSYNLLKYIFDKILFYLLKHRLRHEVFNHMDRKPLHDYYIYSVFGAYQDFPIYVTRKYKSKCVSIIHDVRFILRRNEETSIFSIFWWLKRKFFFRRLLDSSDFILVPSIYIKSVIREFFSYEKSFISFCVPEINETYSINISEDDVAFIEGISYDFIFYPATITETKNHNDLLAAFSIIIKQFPGLRLLLCGTNWNSPLGADIQTKIRELDLAGKVSHLGFISDSLKTDLIKKAVCLAVPSQDESFNLGIWEAFALGCPVVCSNDPELKEQVADAALLFKVSNSVDLADKIIILLNDQATRQKLIQRGFRRYNLCRHHSLLSGWEDILFKENESI